METLNEIFSAFKLTKADVNRLSNEAKLAAVDSGTWAVKELPSDVWDLFNEISEKSWYSSMPNSKKISLGFQLYETFPHYYHFLVPFYRAISSEEIIDAGEKKIIWQHFMNYLAAENYYADPVSYVLWVDFFEDARTVNEAWRGLVNNYSDKKSLLVLLEQAGPVPFDLKEIQYHNLLADPENHEVIFKSILHSAFDVYGQIDKKKAANILVKLKVDTKSKNYMLLQEKLKMP